MNGQALRQALHQGERVYGIALEGYGQPTWPAHFARVGLDLVFIDGEHTPLGVEAVAHAVQAYAARGIAPLYRIPEPAPVWASRALDLGAYGVIAPYVETVEQVKGLVGAIRFRPLKGAALSSVLDGGGFPSPKTERYLESVNAGSVLVIMIESPAGVAALPDLLAVGGVDAVLVGPHDLSVANGAPEQYAAAAFLGLVQSVVETCQAYGVGVGVHCILPEPDLALRWIEMGCNLVMYASDTVFIMDAVERGLEAIRQGLHL